MHQRPPRVTLLRDVFHSLAGTWTLNRRLQSEHTAEPSGTCTGTATFTVTQPSPVLDSDGSLNLADAQLLYHEQGEFEMFQNPSSRGGPIPKFTFSRKYIWRLQATDNTHTISVWFTKPGTDTIDYLFHKIDVPSDHNIGPTSTDTMTMTIHGAGGHLCVEDFYSSSYEFHLNQNETDATPRLASFTTTHEMTSISIELDLPEPFASIPRHELTFGPSPIHSLPRISQALGDKVAIYAKREDVNSGIAFGGNKTRKLEYLVPDALAQNCDTLVSIGGFQSNHTRQVAGVAAKLGLKAKLVQEKWVPHEDVGYDKVGNIQLSRLMNADVRLDASGFGIEHKQTLAQLTQQVIDNGGKPYYIPAGASDHPLGGLGFARWAFEVRAQELSQGLFFDTIIVCAVTGSTFAGMIAGFKLLEKLGRSPARKVIGIDASAKPDETFAQVLRIAKQTASKIGLDDTDVTEKDVILDTRYHGGIYGIADQATLDAIRFGASTEGFITDPVYEGKSLAGMVDLVKKGEIQPGSTVLYAHLGGQLALNAYSDIQ